MGLVEFFFGNVFFFVYVEILDDVMMTVNLAM